MAVERLVAMASGAATMRGVERVFSPFPMQQSHGDFSTSFVGTAAKKTPCNFDAARFSIARLAPCGATASTSTSTANSKSNSAPGTFEVEAGVGRVECCGKGCRPRYEDETVSSFLSVASPVDDCWQGGFQSTAGVQIKVRPHIEEPMRVRYLCQSGAVCRSFELALQQGCGDSQHLSEFAVFWWKSLGDLDKAEELYQEAIDGAVCEDTDALAGHANFLWQCDL